MKLAYHTSLTLLVLGLGLAGAPAASALAQTPADAASVTYHVYLPLVQRGDPDLQDDVQPFARDVYVVVGATLRNPTESTSPDAPLFNIAAVNLDITWGEWNAASAASQALWVGGPNGPQTDVRIQLTGLVPGGVYSVFYVTINPDSENPLCPGVERALPLTAINPQSQLPDESSFVADVNGATQYHGFVDGDIQAPLQLLFEIIYHFDGQAYHPLPNRGEFLTQGANCRSSFGEDAMRQLIITQKFQ